MSCRFLALVKGAVRDVRPKQKRLLRRWEGMTLDAAIDDSIAEFGEAFKTGEPQHHMNAFLERKRGIK